MALDIAAQGAFDAANTAVNEYLQAGRDKRSQAYAQENMRLAKKLNLESANESAYALRSL